MASSQADNKLSRQLWSPDGTLAWEGVVGEVPPELGVSRQEVAILERLLAPRRTQRSVAPASVLRAAEDLEFVTRRGCPPGFFNVLPKGMLLERCVETFNRSHRRDLTAVEMQFPLVFNGDESEFAELTRTYERDSRVFRLGEPDAGLRLAYAADPGLFALLRDCVFRSARLPYAISSPLYALRRWKSGELGDLDHARQYPLSDIHIITAPAHALDSYVHASALAAARSRFWFGEDWLVFTDVTQNFVAARPQIGGDLAKATNKWTLVTVLRAAPRYYAMRSGILVNAGYQDVMLYNLQWDEENGGRFRIRTDAGESVVIVHGNMLTGWPLLLPIVLGRALADVTPRCIPIELAPTQIALLPIADRHVDSARAWMDGQPWLRCALATPDRPLRSRIAEATRNWLPYYAVVGDNEADGEAVCLTTTTSRDPLPIEAFSSNLRARIEQCAVDIDISNPTVPFVVQRASNVRHPTLDRT